MAIINTRKALHSLTAPTLTPTLTHLTLPFSLTLPHSLSLTLPHSLSLTLLFLPLIMHFLDQPLVIVVFVGVGSDLQRDTEAAYRGGGACEEGEGHLPPVVALAQHPQDTDGDESGGGTPQVGGFSGL